MNDFDRTAPLYDVLQSLVFGDALLKAAKYHFGAIAPDQRILILGGGSGRILTHLPSDVVVDYLDRSKSMLNRAGYFRRAGTTLIHADFLEHNFERQRYDVIICPFFFDVFDQPTLDRVLIRTRSLADDRTRLFVADFDRSQKVVHRSLLWLMHFFFRWSAGLQSKFLQPLRKRITASGWQAQEHVELKRGLIFSDIYRF